ncbi:hypothetical protein MIS33_10815 [Wielerella bovis]|uniref:hypothetical protein n=1 Tax=Wielerella bovis TaxID=2917790 RepID=UPI0020188D59|nr:hypothetical protein [Wielerella bovis]ULJ60113.1 hypothetical protein MIS44_10725 [Wielerella bovis]ULJ64603.1 hypothetical protein MIS33_10815 [Wielerella bovis]
MSLNFNEQTPLIYQKKIVMGVSRFKGEVDKTQIDNCNVLIAAPLSSDTGNAKGFGVAKVPFGKSDNFNKFLGVTFPCEMELAFTTETNASGKQREVLKDIRLIAPPAKG